MPTGIYTRTEEHKKILHKVLAGRIFTDEHRKKISLSLTGKKLSEETKKKIGNGQRGKKRGPHSEETKKKMSDAHKGKILSEEHKQKIGESLKGKHLSEETKIKIGNSSRGKPRTSETKIKISKGEKGKSISEETRKKLSITLKGRSPSSQCLTAYKTEETRKKMSESKKGKIHTEKRILNRREILVGGFWYGNVRNDYQYPIYCEKFYDVRPRVIAFFGGVCAICGKPAVNVHHVFYVKKACCWYDENGIYYTNLNVKNHPQNDYYIGENPNYFVLLCDSHHSKTGGNFNNRKYWADYFRDLINEKYNGKCYFAKEEMEKVEA